jgi:hypothetical protein
LISRQNIDLNTAVLPRRMPRWLGLSALVVILLAAACKPDHPVPPPGNKLVMGIGPELNVAETSRLDAEAPLGMLTSWFNGHGDLRFMEPWKSVDVPNAYASGKAMHVIVWAKGAEKLVSTKYGEGCGRNYPLTKTFIADMKALADIFAGPDSGPPLFVTLFTEFQTYPCRDSAWNPNPQTNNYLRALKDRYVEARQIFKDRAPNARVSLGWGGWQNRWDEPGIDSGRSMFQHFADVMKISDFQSFQAMESDSNTEDIKAMTKTLGAYGPVMVAHHKPDDSSQATFDADVKAIFTDTFLSAVKQDGLFAYSFMDDKLMANEESFQSVRAAVTKYGAMP